MMNEGETHLTDALETQAKTLRKLRDLLGGQDDEVILAFRLRKALARR